MCAKSPINAASATSARYRDEREPIEPCSLGWNQSKALNNFRKVWECQETRANDGSESSHVVHGFRTSSGASNSTDNPQERGDMLPQFLGRSAI